MRNHFLLSVTHVYCSLLMKLWTAVSDQTKGLLSRVISESHGNYHMLGDSSKESTELLLSCCGLIQKCLIWRVLSAATCMQLLHIFFIAAVPLSRCTRNTAGRMNSVHCRGDRQYFRCVFQWNWYTILTENLTASG